MNGDSIAFAVPPLLTPSVQGGKGADSINILSGVLGGSGILGGLGNDTITFTGGSISANDLVMGGAGADSINFNLTGNVITVAGGGLGDTIGWQCCGTVFGDGIGTVDAGSGTGGTADGNDSITGSVSGATILGGGGNDTISISAAISSISVNGGAQADRITLGTGAAIAQGGTVDGGKGADTIYVGDVATGLLTINGGFGNDTIRVSANTAITINGGAGNDTIRFLGISGGASLNGGGNNDLFLGSALSAGDFVGTFDGGAGSDSINMGVMSACLSGGAGNDGKILSGGLTNLANSIIGGAGQDTVTSKRYHRRWSLNDQRFSSVQSPHG